MAVVSPGDAVIELVEHTSDRLVIVAPYIKSTTIRRLIASVPATVAELTCITRWLPEDIASGVCDLEIFDDILNVRGGRLLVHPHLHAKYYSNGRQTLVGSANLSRAASAGTLLPTLRSSSPCLRSFQDWQVGSLCYWNPPLGLPSNCASSFVCRPTRSNELDHYTTLRKLKRNPERPERLTLWVPQCPVPERLWEVYRGGGADTMVSSAYKAAQDDLEALSPPQGLTEELFTAYVAGILVKCHCSPIGQTVCRRFDRHESPRIPVGSPQWT